MTSELFNIHVEELQLILSNYTLMGVLVNGNADENSAADLATVSARFERSHKVFVSLVVPLGVHTPGKAVKTLGGAKPGDRLGHS